MFAKFENIDMATEINCRIDSPDSMQTTWESKEQTIMKRARQSAVLGSHLGARLMYRQCDGVRVLIGCGQILQQPQSSVVAEKAASELQSYHLSKKNQTLHFSIIFTSASSFWSLPGIWLTLESDVILAYPQLSFVFDFGTCVWIIVWFAKQRELQAVQLTSWPVARVFNREDVYLCRVPFCISRGVPPEQSCVCLCVCVCVCVCDQFTIFR